MVVVAFKEIFLWGYFGMMHCPGELILYRSCGSTDDVVKTSINLLLIPAVVAAGVGDKSLKIALMLEKIIGNSITRGFKIAIV